MKEYHFSKNSHGISITILLSLVFTFIFFLSSAVYALPVIPSVSGYGTETAAGRGGRIIKVTSLEDSNEPGTLRYAVSQKGPRIVVFEVSGTIEVNSLLQIINPYITIAGQTAPSPGIFLRGAAVIISTHDVLLQHIRVAPGDDPLNINSVATTNRDCVAIGAGSTGEAAKNIVIDHCTFTWSVDEIFSAWGPYGDITFNNVIASEPLNDSIHIDEQGDGTPAPHGFGPVFDNIPDSRTTLVGSLLSHATARQPMIMASDYVQVNNVLYDRQHGFMTYQTQKGVPSKSSIVGNIFIEGPSLADWAKGKPIEIGSNFVPEGKFYLSDNVWQGHTLSTQWDLINNKSSYTQANMEVAAPPVWSEGLVAKPVEEVFDWVLANAGARPADRLPYESRIVNQARNGTGIIVNSIEEAGGWPVVAENRRKLVIPKNPGADNDGDGYTNIEEWLESYGAYVEGRGEEPPLIDPEDGEPEEDIPGSGEGASTIVTDLVVNSGAIGYDKWKAKSNIKVEDFPYADRPFTFDTIPSSVAGIDWIQVANDSKRFTGDILCTFKVNTDSIVYAAFDDRLPVVDIPSWRDSWIDTGEDIVVASPALLSYSLFKNYYPAGSVVSLGNNGNIKQCQYFILVKANAAPELDPISNKTLNEGKTLEFNINATDLNGDNLVYSIVNLPVGAKFDTTAAKFLWTPDYTQSGEYKVTFLVSDGNLIDSREVIITVENVTANQLTVSLSTYLNGMDLNVKPEFLLVKKLEDVSSSLEKENYKLALTKMKVFMNEVKILDSREFIDELSEYILMESIDICMAIKADAQGKDKSWVNEKVDEIIERLKAFKSESITDDVKNSIINKIDDLILEMK